MMTLVRTANPCYFVFYYTVGVCTFNIYAHLEVKDSSYSFFFGESIHGIVG